MRTKTYMIATLLSGVAFAGPAFAQATPNNTQQPANPQAQPELNAAPTDQTPATQENAADTGAQDRQDTQAGAPETIVVTGSRIASPNITSLQPVQVVGETEIDQSGATNVQEVLLQNPAVGTPLLSRTNQAFTTSGGGAATIDLRDLGSNRTLVLINGRRVVGGLANSPIVDLNVIPTQFVERIDILTGGASSLYGSDAVAGVVNFIYKRNFEGVLAEGQYGITQLGDTPTYQLSLTTGANFADGRGNIMVHAGYSNEGQLLSRERKDSRIDNLSQFWYFTGDPADYLTPVTPFFSSFPTQGRFGAGDYTFTYGNNGALQPCFTSNGATCTSFIAPTPDDPTTPEDESDPGVPLLGNVNNGVGTGPNGFNRQFFRSLAVPVRRYVFAAQGHYDITPSISTILEATYVKTQSHSEIEPFAFDSGGANPLTPSGTVNIATMVNGALVYNPYVPQAIRDQAVDTNGDGLPDITIARRLAEFGDRTTDTDRDFFRLVAGLEGKVFNDRFNWDVTYNVGQTTQSLHGTGQINYPNLRQALQAIPGSTPGSVVCADPDAQQQGCVPVNFFGVNSITPEMAAWLNADAAYRVQLKQRVWAANFSGSLVDLPAGPLGVAVGAEYRKESSFDDWDTLTNLGQNGGNAAPDTKGSFSVKEAYGELNVPILRDMAFAHALNLRGAGRISDYTTIGKVTTWSVGGDYAPIEDVRFRATLAKAVRAPNIGELFTGPSQTFPTGLQDPCVGVTASSTGAVSENCRAAPGVLANIALNGSFTQTQADQQGISGFLSGNPNLGPETAKSFTAGVVVNPRSISALRNLVLSVDYYNIRIEDAVAFPSPDTILSQCYEFNNPAFCAFITRRATQVGSSSPGSLAFVNSGAVNSGGLKTRGVDTVLTYRSGLGAFFGSPLNMNARIAWTHLLEGYQIDLPGAPKDRFAGEIGSAKDRVNATVAFDSGRFGWSLTGNYIGKSYEDDESLKAYGLEMHDISVPAQFYLNTQFSFTPVRAYEFYVGINNVLNHKAPVILQGSNFNTTGSQTAEDVYDVFGRSFYAGVRLRF